MTVTLLSDKVDDIIMSLDELGHIPTGELNNLRTKLEDILEMFDDLADKYGDEGPCSDGDEE
jgi:hypothetical protein